jgi:hypothetical protein
VASRSLSAWVEPLRSCGQFDVRSDRLPWARTVLLVFVCGGLAGLMMGSYAGRIEQCLLSAVKVPMLLLLSAATCLPAFMTIHAMLGLRHDMQALLRAVLATMAAFAVTLASVGPVLLLVYYSVRDYSVARLASGAVFALACVPAQAVFAEHFRPLVAKQQQHGFALKTWLVLYVFVTFQLAWLLRPFVGAPELPVRWFREDAFGNAYVEVGGILRDWLTGS